MLVNRGVIEVIYSLRISVFAVGALESSRTTKFFAILVVIIVYVDEFLLLPNNNRIGFFEC